MTPPRIIFTVSAAARYVERVRPGIDTALARMELAALAQFGQIIEEPPDWYLPGTDNEFHPPAGFLILGDVAFPLQPDRPGGRRLVAVTCLTRGLMGEETRQNRNAGRRRRREYRRMAGRMKHGRESRRARLALQERP